MRKLVLAAVMSAIVVAGPARAGCWNAEEASAASVRDMQTMLMVATLRCQVVGHSMSADYNGFLQADRAALQTANTVLKRHFIRTSGPVSGQAAYDGFTTALANFYGGHGSGADTCADMAAAARDAQLMAGSLDGLAEQARRMGLATALPDGRCNAAAGGAQVAILTPAKADDKPVQVASVAP